MNSREYINSKTNSILKYSVIKNNRDVVATIVFNELTDLLEYVKTSGTTKDVAIISKLIGYIHRQLYSNVPMKLKSVCGLLVNCRYDLTRFFEEINTDPEEKGCLATLMLEDSEQSSFLLATGLPILLESQALCYADGHCIDGYCEIKL